MNKSATHYRTAIVGLGRIAWLFDETKRERNTGPLTHAGAYAADPRTVLVGVVSPDTKERSQFEKKFNIPTFATITELLEKVSPDIVSICSPTELHFEHAKICLEERVPMIWLEKPPSQSLNDLDRLITLQTESGVSKVLVNYLRRYSSVYNKLRSLLKEKVYGETVMVHVTYSRGLYLNGSHILDIVFFLIGDKCEIVFDSITQFSGSENPSFSFRFSNGLQVIVVGIEVPYHCIDITVTCEKGRLSVLYGGIQGKLESVTEQEDFPGFYRLKETACDSLSSGKVDEQFPAALCDLISSYNSGIEPISNLHTAKRTQELLSNVESAR